MSALTADLLDKGLLVTDIGKKIRWGIIKHMFSLPPDGGYLQRELFPDIWKANKYYTMTNILVSQLYDLVEAQPYLVRGIKPPERTQTLLARLVVGSGDENKKEEPQSIKKKQIDPRAVLKARGAI